jgi:site-specific DNA-cytosine methylase
MDEQSRVTPFTVLDWLDKLTVDRVIIENVPEFQSWGPLDADNRPNSEYKGATFDAFIAMMRSLGYFVDWRVLNAADYGAPTTRRRLFIQAVRRGCGKELLWPEQSHFPTLQEDELFTQGKQWVPAREIIDWSIPKKGLLSREKPLKDSTIEKVIDGIRKYWTPTQCEPFIARYNSGRNRVHHRAAPDAGHQQPLRPCRPNRHGLLRQRNLHIRKPAASHPHHQGAVRTPGGLQRGRQTGSGRFAEDAQRRGDADGAELPCIVPIRGQQG